MAWWNFNKGNDCNTLAAAWDEWNQLTHTVTAAGYGHLVRAYEPTQYANLDAVRDAIDTLRELYQIRVGERLTD